MQNLVHAVSPSLFGYIFPCTRPVLNVRGLQRRSKFFQSNLFGSSFRPSKALKKRCKSAEKGVCRSEFAQDAPFVVAIGACVLSSLILIKNDDKKIEHSTDAALGGDDVRNGAMTIISFIPLFNWLGWVFAWLDTNEQRYLLYASVYLAPYVRNGFSLSSDENWLLLLSYMACIGHVQLEISAQSGGLEFGNTFLQDGLRQLQKKGRSGFLGNQSKNFQESVSLDDEDANPLAEEDFSQIELSEFDKKLSGKNKEGEGVEQPVVKSSEDVEKKNQSAETSDE
eukprot:c22062_g1_i1 orf=259-1104(-)